VDSRPQWGTRVQARLPYRPASLLPPRLGARPAESVRGGEPVPGVSGTAAPPSRTPPAGEESAKPLRVLVVDDHVVIRQGIRAMLEEAGDIAVVGEAGDGAEAVAQANALRPDVALMDLQMPGVDGLEGLRRLRLEQPELPVVILTTFQTDTAVREALGAGARGYLLKDTEPANLIAAVRAASRGESLLAPAVTERLSALAAGTASMDGTALNEREKEVLALLAQGARNKEIAERMFITPKTVEYHLSHIFEKLGVSNRTEAVRVALACGLVSSEGRSVK
jgi:DNA-binding NarL/FixJ family response regulator